MLNFINKSNLSLKTRLRPVAIKSKAEQMILLTLYSLSGKMLLSGEDNFHPQQSSSQPIK
ncbi:hypothetical protein [Thalassomonas sp. RHCl1]|uniref:hypothetical protein n=1 Tax=Thalassomonas sp. RHCl1 TaxID=2995320 RepID=UPI00248AA21D|nr:hypothetical protein [Thalassomonas sp. RHCl1]